MGIRKFDANPRKMPVQARSRATVDAILTAAAHILVKHGYEGSTTARVAERAGVSIGSLYQYFPNKEALIIALIEQHGRETLALIERTLEDPALVTLEDGLRALIRAGCEAHRIHPALHKILTEQVPRVGRFAKVMDTHRTVTAMVERFLRAHIDELAPGRDPVIAATVIETAVEALVHKAVIERQDLLADGLIEQEAFELIRGYLLRPSDDGRKSAKSRKRIRA